MLSSLTYVDADPPAGHRTAQRERVVRLEGAIHSRNGIPVGVVVRMSQKLSQPLREPVRDSVLEPLGLLVHLLPGVPEVLDQKGLDQTVPP
jgi:hypothetical protein